MAAYSLGDMGMASARLEDALAALGRPWPGTRPQVVSLLGRAMVRQVVHRLLPPGGTAPSSQESAERTEMAGALGALIRTYYPSGNVLGAVTANFHALNLAEDAGEAPEVAGDLATAYTNVGAALDNVLGLHRIAARYYDRARAVAETAGHLPALAHLEKVRGMIFTMTRRLDQAAAPFERAAALYRELGDSRGWEEVCYSNAGRALACGDLRGALGLMEGVVASARHRDSPQACMLGLAQLALVLLRLGRMHEAEQTASEGRAIHTREPFPAERIYVTGVLALARALQGSTQGLLPLIEEVADLSAAVGLSGIAVEGYLAAGEAAVLLLEDPVTAGPPGNRARLLRLGTMVHRPLARTSRYMASLYAPPAERLAGDLAAAKGRVRAALRCWRWSLARAAGDGQRWDEAQAALALARFDPSPAQRARHAARAGALFAAMGAAERRRRLDLPPRIP
jgi:tetratricopeptide (TPR) repeat protein